MRAARRSKGVFLEKYFDRMYEEGLGDGVSLYVGVHEMCHLSSTNPCPAGSHLECLAQRVVAAYNAMKVSTPTTTFAVDPTVAAVASQV